MVLIKKYLKWGLIIIVVILIIGAVFGEDQTEEEAQTTETQTEEVQTEDANIDYEIISQKDFNFKDDDNVKVVRYGLNVLVNEQVSIEELKEVSKEIVEEEKKENEFNAVSINFYDNEEFTSGISSVPPLGIVEYAPNGEWSKADTVDTGDYGSMEYNWKLKEKDWDNQLTEEELEIYGYIQEEYEAGVGNKEEIYQNVSNKHDISTEKVKETYDKAMNWIHQ